MGGWEVSGREKSAKCVKVLCRRGFVCDFFQPGCVVEGDTD